MATPDDAQRSRRSRAEADESEAGGINFRGSGGIDPEKGFKKEIEEKKRK